MDYDVLEAGVGGIKYIQPTNTMAFEGELKCCSIPVARALGVTLTLFVILGGAGFTESLCTAGMKAISGLSLAVSSSFVLFGLLVQQPYPCTFSFARKNGLHSFFSVCFCLYHGIMIGIVTAIFTLASLYNFVSIKDLIDWSCSSEDDDDDRGRGIFNSG